MAITISGENNNDRILASDGVIDSLSGFNVVGVITATSFTGDLTGDVTGNLTGNVTGNINNTTLLLQTGGTERIRITSSGNVGIGTDNPSAPLHIFDTSDAVIRLESSDNGAVYHTYHRDNAGTKTRIGYMGFGGTGGTLNIANEVPDGNIFFQTTPSGASAGAEETAFRIYSDKKAEVYGDLQISDKIIHTNDTNTAIRFPANDTITAETGGSERLRITSGGDILTGGLTSRSFENDSTNQFILEVTGDGSVGTYGMINVSGNSNSNNTPIGRINFVNRENSASTSVANAGSKSLGSIDVYADTSDSNAGDDSGGFMRFSTKQESGGSAERLRIDSSGKIGISRTPTQHPLEIQHASEPTVSLWRGSTKGAALQAQSGGTYFYSYENAPLIFSVNSAQGFTERLRIDSNGRIIIGTNTAFATAQAYRLFQIGQADGGWINLARTATPGDGNHLGAIQGFARGADGNYHDTVAIDFKADGTPSNTSKPSKIEFYATPSGSTSKELKKTIRQDGLQQNYVGTQPFDIYSTGSGEKYSLRLLNSDASAGNQIGIYFGPSNNVAGAYIAGYAYGDFASTANRDAGLRFGVRQNGTFKEVVRINDGGFFQATNVEGDYETHTFAADLGHQFNSNQRYKNTLWLRNTNTNFENGMLRCAADRAANTAYHFIVCTSGDLSDDEFRVRGDGKVYGDNNYTVGADYAEYFEWSDGNTSNQDRRGMTVVLDGNKVKLSTSSDSADNIIGVVSGSPSVVGDSSWSAWSQKYLKDDYNQYILDSDGYRQLNSSYDDTKTYIPRAERQEWDAIGMVGKLRIVKGQKTGTRWIKMRDVSDTIEEWLVR